MIRGISQCGTVISIILLIGMFSLLGCGSGTTPTSQLSSKIATASTITTVSSISTPATKSIKIGIMANLKSNVSLDWIRAVEVQAGADNSKGGLDIGGTKYLIDLVKYDSGGDQVTEVAAVNRFVYQDDVKFIVSEGQYASAWLPVTEKEKVVVFTASPPAPMVLTPNFNYSFQGSFLNPMTTVVTAWYFNQHPEAKNSFINAFPDDQFGHMVSGFVASVNKPFGITSKDEFFAPSMQDLSSLGTKIAAENPAVFGCVTESDAQTAQIYNAVRQAGYKGQFLNANVVSTSALKQSMNPDALEGFICAAMPTEFDPPLTTAAKDFEDAWVAKYGSWEDPAIGMSSSFWALRAALMQAGTIDSNTVAAAIGSGVKYESPIGSGEMISRPDLGNVRAVDSIATYYVKQVKDGKPILVATISLDDAIEIFKTAYPPGSGGPPAGMSGPPDASGPPRRTFFRHEWTSS